VHKSLYNPGQLTYKYSVFASLNPVRRLIGFSGFAMGREADPNMTATPLLNSRFNELTPEVRMQPNRILVIATRNQGKDSKSSFSFAEADF
jgi:hypothetical protein